jgi:minor histocompatibility antigen H13
LSMGDAFSKPFFYACFGAYILGLATTVAVMHVFKAAQPALLYLSPACILAPLLVSLYKGETRALFDFQDNAVDSVQGQTEPAKESNVPSIVTPKKSSRIAVADLVDTPSRVVTRSQVKSRKIST